MDLPVGAKDLTITGATVYVDETGLSECSGAILAGNVMGSDTQSVVFENITVSGSVYVTRTNGYNNIGGMLGYASWVKATNCHADGVSISGASNCGGFVGNDSGSIYENCTASGTIDGAWVVGGFVGYSSSAIWQDPAGASTYTKCSADVDVSGNDWRVGGFVGFAEYGQFNNCVAYGDVTSIVTGWEPKVGGFVGEDSSNVNITACHAAGVVTGVSSDYQAGGFIGAYSGGIFTGCSFDSEKNPDLNVAGEGTIASDAVTGEESAVVLSSICEDYFGSHQYSSEWTVDTEATCITDGSKYQPCERCGAKGNITAIPATGHSPMKTEAQDPTCTTDGNITYWHCTVCDKYFKDEGLTQEITKEDTILKATGHKYTTTPTSSWSEDNSKVTITFTCLNDETYKEVLEATVTSVTVEPTTDKEGKTTYTATATFEGKEYTDTKEVVLDKLPEEVLPPVITSGNNATWNTNSSDSLSFTSDAEYQDFIKVLVDDKEVDNKYYTVKEGSTIVTLSNDFLKTLSVGKHTLSIVSVNGTATATFTIEAATITVPDTGNDITDTYCSLYLLSYL